MQEIMEQERELGVTFDTIVDAVGSGAVSYTHLDVYKRQGRHSGPGGTVTLLSS